MATLGQLGRVFTGGSPAFNEQTGMYRQPTQPMQPQNTWNQSLLGAPMSRAQAPLKSTMDTGMMPAAPMSGQLGGVNPLAGLSDAEKYAVFGGAGGGQALTQEGSWARQLHDSFGTPYSAETGQSQAFKNWLNNMSYGEGARSYFDPTSGKVNTKGGGSRQLDLSAFGIQPSGSVTPPQVSPAAAMPAPAMSTPGTGGGTLSSLASPQGMQPAMPAADLDISKYLDPSMDFRIKQGTDALQSSAAARGGLLSGNTMKGITDYAQNVASQEYGNAFGRAFEDRGYGTDVFRDARNFGYGVDRDDRDFNYRASVDDRNFNFDRERYNTDMAYRAAVDDRNFNFDRDKYNQEFGYRAQTGDRAFNQSTLSELARLGLGAVGNETGTQQLLAQLLNSNIMQGGNAGAAGSIGGANNINQMITQLLQQMQQQQLLSSLPGG